MRDQTNERRYNARRADASDHGTLAATAAKMQSPNQRKRKILSLRPKMN